MSMVFPPILKYWQALAALSYRIRLDIPPIFLHVHFKLFIRFKIQLREPDDGFLCAP